MSIVRGLTPAEARLAASVFGSALDASRVRIHGRRYLLGQGRGVAMSPNGNIYFRAEDYRTDFTTNLGDAAWLIHELTHAWQHQQGIPVRLRGLLEQLSRVWGRNPYAYGRIDPARPFRSYGLEQQAAIVEDFLRVRSGAEPRYGSGPLVEYRAAIPFPAS